MTPEEIDALTLDELGEIVRTRAIVVGYVYAARRLVERRAVREALLDLAEETKGPCVCAAIERVYAGLEGAYQRGEVWRAPAADRTQAEPPKYDFSNF